MVNSLRTIKIIGIQSQRQGRKFLQSRDHVAGVRRIGHDIGIHFVISNLTCPGRRGIGRIIWLRENIIEEKITLRIDVSRNKPALIRRRFQDSGGGDRHRAGIQGAITGRRNGAVGGVINVRSRCGGRNRDIKRGGVMPAVDIKRSVLHKSGLRCSNICGSRRGLQKISRRSITRVRLLLWISRRELLYHRGAIRRNEREVFPAGFQAEVGMQIPGAVRRVRPGGKDHEILFSGQRGPGRKSPLRKLVRVVRQIIPAEIERRDIAIMNLNPIRRIAITIVKLGIARNEFADLRSEIETVDGNLQILTHAALGIRRGESINLGRRNIENNRPRGPADKTKSRSDFNRIRHGHIPAQRHKLPAAHRSRVG